MFGTADNGKPSQLDKAIDKVYKSLETFAPEDPEYALAMDKLERLMKLKTENRRKQVSGDTLVTVGGTLLGILCIVAYEQKHVMVSKAMALLK